MHTENIFKDLVPSSGYRHKAFVLGVRNVICVVWKESREATGRTIYAVLLELMNPISHFYNYCLE